ncbi:hypothetical protein [Rhodococcus sp. NPDC058481]|uniref:hypothetical protein n=1 Tax=unclassified Rhodococcus (in: high G+C Gram-positive bacteria) TaxID=192944 RepID=UPI00365DC1CF
MDWYTGFGQWLGALGSLLAAGAALWIATTDRRRTDLQRKADQDAQDGDLAREAGLVRVAIFPPRAERSLKPSDEAPGISVRNWRRSPLFDLRLESIVVQGETILAPGIGYFKFPLKEASWGEFGVETLARKVIDSGDLLSIFPEAATVEGRATHGPPELRKQKAEHVVLRYTDDTGRRWEVDSVSHIARRVC